MFFIRGPSHENVPDTYLNNSKGYRPVYVLRHECWRYPFLLSLGLRRRTAIRSREGCKLPICCIERASGDGQMAKQRRECSFRTKRRNHGCGEDRRISAIDRSEDLLHRPRTHEYRARLLHSLSRPSARWGQPPGRNAWSLADLRSS